MYKKFAYVYDKLSSNVNYDGLLNNILKYITKENKILDLACGTGNISILLKNRGFNVTGLDLSRDMLNVAKSKDPLGTYILADMTNFSLKDKFDAVLCMLDSMNYLTSKKKVLDTFLCVKKSLCDRGLFIFDLNSDKYYKRILHNKVHVRKKDDIIYTWKSKFKNKRCYMNLEFFTPNGIIIERQVQRAYSKEEIINLGRMAGFQLIKTHINTGYRKLFVFKPV